jgi:hypothetical protein
MGDRDRLWAAAPFAAALAAAVVLLLLTLQLPLPRPGTLGPAFWPRLAIGLMAAVSAFELVRIALGRTRAPAIVAEEGEAVAPRQPLRLLSGVAVIALYAASIATLGHLLASFLFLVGFMYVGGYRNHLVLWTSAAGGMIALAFMFQRIVYVSLPRGTPPFDGWMQGLLRLVGIN